MASWVPDILITIHTPNSYCYYYHLSGSDDGTIKIWSGEGMNDLIQTLSEKSAVTCLCIDAVNGAIIAGLQNIIK